MIEYARELDLTPELFEEDLKELFKAASSDDHSRLEKVLDRLLKNFQKSRFKDKKIEDLSPQFLD